MYRVSCNGRHYEKTGWKGIYLNVNKFLKNLKRKLRWKRKWLAFGLLIVVSGWALGHPYEFFGPLNGESKLAEALSVFNPIPGKEFMDNKAQEKAVETMKHIKGKLDTYLEKDYVCGEETQRLGSFSSEQLLNTHKKHPNWSIDILEDKVVFTERIDDLSPECKHQAYFGMDQDGNLSLFNGLPSKENIIRTFFQLNIQYLESSLPKETVKELQDGIRISDISEYNSVLSTFSDYAVEDSERAMTPQ
jgi:forespore regulator of the sigma-K checkpoint